MDDKLMENIFLLYSCSGYIYVYSYLSTCLVGNKYLMHLATYIVTTYIIYIIT
jgi:hypothetical protein